MGTTFTAFLVNSNETTPHGSLRIASRPHRSKAGIGNPSFCQGPFGHLWHYLQDIQNYTYYRFTKFPVLPVVALAEPEQNGFMNLKQPTGQTLPCPETSPSRMSSTWELAHTLRHCPNHFSRASECRAQQADAGYTPRTSAWVCVFNEHLKVVSNLLQNSLPFG